MIAIVCNGKEVSYGFSLLHLLKYRSEDGKTVFFSKKGVNVELFSAGFFKHANVSKKTIKIFIGDAQEINGECQRLYRRFGMEIWKLKNDFILKTNVRELKEENYNEFIVYANNKRKEYLELEKEYVTFVNEIDDKWITGEFKIAFFKGIFSQMRKIEIKHQQQYDCLALVFVLDFLKNG